MTCHILVASSIVNLWAWDYVDSTSTFTPMSIQDYTKMVVRETQNRDMWLVSSNTEEYFIWPDTMTVPSDWGGWCLEIINNRNVPVACP